jgi:hypothetical protein
MKGQAMRSINLTVAVVAAATVAATVLTYPLKAEDKDVFAFIPVGGRTLLADVFSSKPPAAEVKGILSGKRDRAGWLAYLKDHGKAIPALGKLDDKETRTLADYLAHTMPLPANEIPADTARATWSKVLPMDGRDYAMEKCQGCHIITVVITQDRPREHWLGTMHKPSHIGIRMTEAQREQVADYLVINGGIPIDQVPEELRAGGASY